MVMVTQVVIECHLKQETKILVATSLCSMMLHVVLSDKFDADLIFPIKSEIDQTRTPSNLLVYDLFLFIPQDLVRVKMIVLLLDTECRELTGQQTALASTLCSPLLIHKCFCSVRSDFSWLWRTFTNYKQ